MAEGIRGMFEQDSRDPVRPELLLHNALSRWDNEGGAGPSNLELLPMKARERDPVLPSNVTNLDELHVRVIALDN